MPLPLFRFSAFDIRLETLKIQAVGFSGKRLVYCLIGNDLPLGERRAAKPSQETEPDFFGLQEGCFCRDIGRPCRKMADRRDIFPEILVDRLSGPLRYHLPVRLRRRGVPDIILRIIKIIKVLDQAAEYIAEMQLITVFFHHCQNHRLRRPAP